MENTNGMLDLSENEMLNMWKTLLHLDTARHDCTLEREDGIDLDSLLTMHLRQWYAELLATATAELLPTDDVAAEVTLTADVNGAVTAMVPAQCVRPVEWQLRNWQHSVTQFLQPDSPEAKPQHNQWTCGKSHNPAAIDYGNRLLLLSCEPGEKPELVMARCVVRPADGHYRLHQRLIAQLPDLPAL